MRKKNIAVVMGGYSTEYEISLQSGAVVCNELNKEIYNVYAIHILKKGWYFVSDQGEKYNINKENFSFSDGNNTVIPDAVFNTIHGTPGEDGFLQAYFEILEIPQTSAPFYPAALSFNKRDCLRVLSGFGVQCASSFYLNKGDVFSEDEILNKVGLPCFVKPNRAGSSYGISKVSKGEDLKIAIEKAFEEDFEIIIETALVGTEVSVGVFNNKSEIIVLPATEIVSENDYFDYEAKYLGKSQEITPARISEKEMNLVQSEAKRIFQLLNMKGITRSDFIIQDGIPFFIEINANPGLSTESIVPKQVHEAGLTLASFFNILIDNVVNNND